jgi:hypothetical protein
MYTMHKYITFWVPSKVHVTNFRLRFYYKLYKNHALTRADDEPRLCRITNGWAGDQRHVQLGYDVRDCARVVCLVLRPITRKGGSQALRQFPASFAGTGADR